MRYDNLSLGGGTCGGEGEGLFGTVDHLEPLLVGEVGVGDEVVVGKGRIGIGCDEARVW
jgi:hypothetical protein